MAELLAAAAYRGLDVLFAELATEQPVLGWQLLRLGVLDETAYGRGKKTIGIACFAHLSVHVDIFGLLQQPRRHANWDGVRLRFKCAVVVREVKLPVTLPGGAPGLRWDQRPSPDPCVEFRAWLNPIVEFSNGSPAARVEIREVGLEDLVDVMARKTAIAEHSRRDHVRKNTANAPPALRRLLPGDSALGTSPPHILRGILGLRECCRHTTLIR